ncbi:hypothetical protein P3T27_005334 [Kitasatospora sp. MAA19]|uniref:DUF3885 domain-containing protein n=1 Tax=Kitasatospora sp. MAA19 TaxID=3035090 RepID=UPI0024740DA3|nr:hypothetical protein [Kitasatospora sp. MAA19]MDH6708594.1 hypothetical protein [Kitasatospora sp. MAA19]
MDREALDALTALWLQRWPGGPPVGHEIGAEHRDVWVRFHSLPESKRYPDDEGEYAVVLERHNTVLDELFDGSDVYVITPTWTSGPDVPDERPAGTHWQTRLQTDDPDPEFRTYCHVFVDRRTWRPGSLDELLRRVADEEVAGVIVADTVMRRLYHPYDGGADVYLTSPEERDRLRERHADWLSRHPQGW